MRGAGKPWRVGNGEPFIAVAISAVRPSRATSVGIPAVNPSTEWLKICVASALTPACSRTVLRGMPCHSALPTRSPPTSFDTCDRHGLDGGRLFNEFFIGKRKWCVDHSVDGERPLVRVNFRNNERSIDAVKLSFGVMYGVMPSMLSSDVAASTVVPLVGAGEAAEGLWRTGAPRRTTLATPTAPAALTIDAPATAINRRLAERSAWHFDVVVFGVVRMVERDEMAMEVSTQRRVRSRAQ